MNTSSIGKLAEGFEKLRMSARRHSSIQMTDDGEIIIDSCRAVTRCDDNFIGLVLMKNVVMIAGLDLTMKNFSNDGVIIRGKIHSVTFGEVQDEK